MHKLIYFLPELMLLSALPIMWIIKHIRKNATSKTYFTLSRWFVLLALVFTIIMRKQSGMPQYYENILYTTLFKSIIYIIALVWFGISCKWFLVEDKSSLAFYALAMSSLVALSILISSLNLGIMAVAWFLINIFNYFLLKLSPPNADCINVHRNYLFCLIFFGLMFIGGCALLYWRCNSLDYGTLYLALSKQHLHDAYALLGVGMILTVLMFSMALAPLHLWYVNAVEGAILPVGGWITLVPVFGWFATLVDLSVNVFLPVYAEFKPALIVFAVLSLVLGAAGVNGENNLRRMFGFSSIFQTGFLLISLISFSANSVFSSFVYLLVYILATMGIYICLFGVRSKGVYVSTLEDISGLSKSKPYISAALLLFMVSLTGSAPTLGFLGNLSVVNNLVMEGNYYLVALVLLTLTLIANGYLRIIKAIYFSPQIHMFDRADRGIYLFLFVNLIIVVVALLSPGLLMNDFEKMLITVF